MNYLIVTIYAILTSLILLAVDLLFSVSYLYGVLLKVLFFVLIPLLLSKYLADIKWKLGKCNNKSSMYGLSLGILGACVITSSYFIFRDYISWEDIYSSMESRNINETTFILVFIYIMFGNALIEEYFFRGFIFYNLIKYNKTIAYIFSSLLFSLYHLSIFATWFHWWIMMIALLGLFLSGLFFAFLYEKTDGIWGAYIFHILADLAIVTIGYLIFFY